MAQVLPSDGTNARIVAVPGALAVTVAEVLGPAVTERIPVFEEYQDAAVPHETLSTASSPGFISSGQSDNSGVQVEQPLHSTRIVYLEAAFMELRSLIRSSFDGEVYVPPAAGLFLLQYSLIMPDGASK